MQKLNQAESQKKSKTTPKRKQYDWKLLTCDKNLYKSCYTIEVKNRFQLLEEEDDSASERYEKFTEANKEAAEKVIPVKNKSRKACFLSDPRVTKAREEIKAAYDTYQSEQMKVIEPSTRRPRKT